MSKFIKPGGLGRGLSALIPTESAPKVAARNLHEDDGVSSGITALVDPAKVRPNRYQPRVEFDKHALEELSASIREQGLIQPITVRRIEGGYELVAGERRLRASIMASLDRIPAYILAIESDARMLELALIENIQRENLNAIEVAKGYMLLIEECHLTQDEVATKVGKDRSTVANFLRLLRLPFEIQDLIRQKKLTMGHAKALLALSEEEEQVELARQALEHEYSVRRTEQAVRERILSRDRREGGRDAVQYPDSDQYRQASREEDAGLRASISDIEHRLRQIFASKVTVKVGEKHQGSIVLDFYSYDDLERLIDLLSQIGGDK